MTRKVIGEVLNLSQPFISKHSYINFSRIIDVLLSDKTTRQKKNWLYSMSINETVIDTIWTKYCEMYLSDRCLSTFTWRESSNIYVNYNDMIY